jgi:hypothetical protein
MIPTITFPEMATDLPDFLAAAIPKNHTVVAQIAHHSATGENKAEAARDVIALWSNAEARRLAFEAWNFNRDAIYA